MTKTEKEFLTICYEAGICETDKQKLWNLICKQKKEILGFIEREAKNNEYFGRQTLYELFEILRKRNYEE